MTMLGRSTLALVLAVAVAACARDEAGDDGMAADSMGADSMAAMQHPAMPATEQLTAEDQTAVQNVRTTADRFKDLAAAKSAGYAKQYPEGCIQTADGSQGFHYLNESLADDRVDLNTPELLMYEPKPDGSMELIGVDYMIPFDKWTAAEPPQILNRPMMRNEPLKVWALHIWTHRDNPSGMFAAYNPAANCDNAAAAKK
jgi:hypothetical protein